MNSESGFGDCVAALTMPPVLQLNGEQQVMGLELVHHVSSLLCLMSSQATAFETLRSEFLAEVKANRSSWGAAQSTGGGAPGLAKFQHKASHNQRLEELRNLQVMDEQMDRVHID